MKTIKTAVVVVLLLAVLYGLYTVLNKPEGASLSDSAWPQAGPLQIGMGEPVTSGELPKGGLDFADKPGTAPPDMASGPPNHLASEFQSDATELKPIHGPPQTKRLTAPKGSSYDKPGGVRGNGDSFVQQAGGSIPPPTVGTKAFAAAWRTANQQLDDGNYRQALASLSVFYDSPDLSPSEQRTLLDALDPLAAKVIYSTEHLLEMPYEVLRGEDLYEVANKFHVPWLLLKNINSVNNQEVLLPGSRLKVLRGPFRAEVKLVDAEQAMLTLFLGELYAGRFPATLGADRPVRPGQYEVTEKAEWPIYYSPSGQSLPSRHPQNPYGRWYLALGSEISIHSSPSTGGGQRGAGSISLSPGDAADIYGILSKGSRVEVKR